MNKWSHFIAAFELAIMALVIHFMIRNDSNVKALDTIRFYTMVREKGDVNTAISLLSQVTYLDASCAKMTNMTQPFAGDAAILACKTARETLRTNILLQMKCNKYSSQVCTYLQKVLTGVLRSNTNTITPGTRYYGKDLTAIAPGSTLTYREVIIKAITEAPNLMHNAYWAKEDPNFVIARTILYNLIASATLANIIVHFLDAMYEWDKGWRLLMRCLVFTLSFLPSLLLMIGDGGSSTILLVGIMIPALLNLLYFEMFLDDALDRPWVHPCFFSVVLTACSLLSLTENNVLNSNIVIVEILKSQATAQLFMAVVWYWTGYMEKARPSSTKPLLKGVYKSKQIQYALFMSIVLVAVTPLTLYLAPYDYSNADVFLRICPLVFTALAIVGTLYLQGLRLDDKSGQDTPVHWESYKADTRELIVYHATRITGGKLGVSALVLVFVVFVQLDLVAEYIRTLRAYYDIMPTSFALYDTASSSSWTSGISTGSVMQLVDTPT
jgi:hypothetical protein